MSKWQLAKLQPHQVEEIRDAWDEYNGDNNPFMKEYADIYNVSPDAIRYVVKNISWKHLKLCKRPFISEKPATDRAFARKCLLEAAIKLAKQKKIWNVTTVDLEIESGGFRVWKFYKTLDEVLKLAEPHVYENCGQERVVKVYAKTNITTYDNNSPYSRW